MITFGSAFLRDEYQEQDDPIREDLRARIDAMGWAEGSRDAVVYEEKIRDAHPIGTVQDVADHIGHAVNLVGRWHT